MVICLTYLKMELFSEKACDKLLSDSNDVCISFIHVTCILSLTNTVTFLVHLQAVWATSKFHNVL